MFRITSITLLVSALAAVAFAAAPPPVTPQTREIRKLIDQLDDADYRFRDLAEKRLALFGKEALPHLRAALSHKELEVRRRAMRLIPGIETAVLFAPKRITLKLEGQPLHKVLEEVSKASGYKVMNTSNGMVFLPGMAGPQPAPVKGGPKEKQFTYTFQDEPFWDVIDRICRDSGLTVQQGYGDEIVRLFSGTQPPHSGRYGPFRYVANNIQLYRNVDLNSANTAHRNETLTLNFNVYVEPRLSFMGQGEVRLDSAYDDLKNSMLIPKNYAPSLDMMWGGRGFGRRSYYGGGYKQQQMSVSVQLQRRSEKATTLKSLKGAVPMTMLVEQRPIVISEKILTANGVKKEIGDLTFEVKEAKKMPNNQVQVQFSVTTKQTNDYSWQNNLYNRIEMFDDKGNKYQIWGTSWGGSGPNNVQMTLTYFNGNNAKVGEPAKFVFMHWEMKQYDVEFEFKDIPLP